ncbi:MAG: GAF domain-containing protein, partial [Desulfovibrionaceae bacterium]|nr:GAF domain-containing protein [Desulfovibrionaceae bacterium]
MQTGSPDFIQTLLRLSPQPLALIDTRNSVLLAWNEPCARLCPVAPRAGATLESLGLSCYDRRAEEHTDGWCQLTSEGLCACQLQEDESTGQALFLLASDESRLWNIPLKQQQGLCQSINHIAHLLLFGESDFDETVNKLLEILGGITGADRAYVWAIHESPYPDINPSLHASQLYEWSAGEDTPQANELTFNRPVEQIMPVWLEWFENNQSINRLVHDMPPVEKEVLGREDTVSVLCSPIFLNGKLHGFIGLDDCHDERIWSEEEEKVLRSVGLLISLAIHQDRMTKDLRASKRRFDYVAVASGEIIWTLDSDECLDYV